MGKTRVGLLAVVSVMLGMSVLGSRGPAPAGADPNSREIASGAEERMPLSPPSGQPSLVQWRIVNVYPHDPTAFTQGLLYDNGFLFESTGLNGRSTLRKVELKTGSVLKSYNLSSQYFGEGLVQWEAFLIQLTWKSGKAFYYDKETFTKVKEYSYSGEGWGITQDGTSLIMSDGTSVLRFINPTTFMEERRIRVRDQDGLIGNLNELEFIKGEIFANIWGEDKIVRVSTRTGEVLGWMDMSRLRNEMSPVQRVDVLNGIAYDEKADRLYMTGKLWPKLFEIELIRP